MSHENATPPEITLRAMEPEDLEMLYRIENDASLWSIGTTNVPYSRYALHDYMARSTGDIYADRQVRLMIENARGETVGMVDIVNFDPRHQRAELGIVIAKGHRRQGYARATLAQIAHYSLTVLHLHQLYALVDTCNEPCLRLFHSLGFEARAELKEWLHDGRGYRNALVMQIFL